MKKKKTFSLILNLVLSPGFGNAIDCFWRLNTIYLAFNTSHSLDYIARCIPYLFIS